MSMAHSVLWSFPASRRPLPLSVQGTSIKQTLRRSSSEILRFQNFPQRIGCVRTASFGKRFQFFTGKLDFCVRAEKSGGGEVAKETVLDEDEEDKEFRGESSTPDRFKIEVAEKELLTLPRWPLFVGAALFVYAWRMVLWELGNWKKTFLAISGFVAAVIDYYLGALISVTLETVRSFYSSIVSNARVPELTTIVILASTVLAISESASPGSSTCQPYLLSVSGLVGYVAVQGFISEPIFWLILFGLFGYARFIKKRDNVTSSLPVATVLASVGEPWVRALAIISFTAVALSHHWSKIKAGKQKDDVEGSGSNWRRVSLPLPLVGIGLAIGMRLAAQWAGYRHLTWKIV